MSISRSRRGGPIHWFIEGETWPEEPVWGDIEPGKLEVIGDNLAGTAARRMGPFLERYGSLISNLSLESRYLGPEARIDLSVLNLAKLCPNLTRLWMQGVTVSSSVFGPAKLEKLHLQECGISGSDALRLGDSQHGAAVNLEEVALYQCNLATPSLSWGPFSGLRDFDYRLDDPSENRYPANFHFADCGELSKLTLDIKGDFSLSLAGIMPQLAEVRLDAGPQHQAQLLAENLRQCTFNLVRKHYC